MTPLWQVTALAVVAGALLTRGAYLIFGFRSSPQKKERMRRMVLSQRGRLCDGVITEASPDSVVYTYSIGGVAYATSQDISELYDFLPADPERLVGPVWIKYSTKNPANSIVISERWSGLKQSTPQKEQV